MTAISAIFIMSFTASFSHTFLAHKIDAVEHMFGATRINGVVGNGGLTVGISHKGEITLFRYPSPSYWDHIDYKTEIVPVDAGYHARDLKYFGALPEQGSFGGVFLNELVWLRDLDTEQKYYNEDSGVLVTVYKFPDGTTAVSLDFVHPGQDIFIRRFEFEKEVSFIHYQNFAPTTIKKPYFPLSDWLEDESNDFGAFYKDGLIVHFIPYHEDRSELKYEVDQLTNFAKKITGVFIVLGLLEDNSPDFQIGYDGRCGGGRRKPSHRPLSAFDDAKDGNLSSSEYALCSANSALMSEGLKFTLIFSVGDTLSEAMLRFEDAKRAGFRRLFDDTQRFWKEFLRSARFPRGLTPAEEAFCKRTLISIFKGTDRKTGAIVASVSTQPPYAEDWPRDGAFINLLLDIFGFKDMVTKHNLFYVKVQRKEGTRAGSFDMNFYADGMPGGVIPFEIDQVGFTLWTWWMHAKFLKGKEREEYIKMVYPSIRLAAKLLIECKDANGLQCLANEDDNPVPSQTLLGASTVYLGLRNALEAARFVGDSEMIAILRSRINELKSAIWENFWLGDFFSGDIGSMSYIIWPALFENKKSKKLEKHYRKLLEVIKLHFEGDGFAYLTKAVIALALTTRPEELEGFLSVLVNEVPTDTLHVGEVVVRTNGGFENRVAIPHLWGATLTCLSAIAMRSPKLLQPKLESEKVRGCSCSLVLPIIFLLWIRRSL